MGNSAGKLKPRYDEESVFVGVGKSKFYRCASVRERPQSTLLCSIPEEAPNIKQRSSSFSSGTNNEKQRQETSMRRKTQDKKSSNTPQSQNDDKQTNSYGKGDGQNKEGQVILEQKYYVSERCQSRQLRIDPGNIGIQNKPERNRKSSRIKCASPDQGLVTQVNNYQNQVDGFSNPSQFLHWQKHYTLKTYEGDMKDAVVHPGGSMYSTLQKPQTMNQSKHRMNSLKSQHKSEKPVRPRTGHWQNMKDPHNYRLQEYKNQGMFLPVANQSKMVASLKSINQQQDQPHFQHLYKDQRNVHDLLDYNRESRRPGSEYPSDPFSTNLRKLSELCLPEYIVNKQNDIKDTKYGEKSKHKQNGFSDMQLRDVERISGSGMCNKATFRINNSRKGYPKFEWQQTVMEDLLYSSYGTSDTAIRPTRIEINSMNSRPPMNIRDRTWPRTSYSRDASTTVPKVPSHTFHKSHLSQNLSRVESNPHYFLAEDESKGSSNNRTSSLNLMSDGDPETGELSYF